MERHWAKAGTTGYVRPEGGYVRIRVVELFMAWWAYREGRIQFRDLRAYFALREMDARRQAAGSNRIPRFRLSELNTLIGGRGERHARHSLRRLAESGLAIARCKEIRFAQSPDEFTSEAGPFWLAVEQIANRRRCVPVPRRTLRLLASARKPVLVATVIGHLFRCVYAKGLVIASDGSVAASWIAEVFGVDPRNVKRARAELRALGWLQVASSDHWHRQRYGERVVVNLVWTAGARPTVPRPELPPRPAFCDTKSPPPKRNRQLLNGSNNQKPVPGAGVQRIPKEEPSLRDVKPDDLRDAGRLLKLFGQAQARGFVGKSAHDRFQFFGAAAHARAFGTQNPGGLFFSLIRDRLWHHITAGDETRAQEMLKSHLFGGKTVPRQIANLSRAGAVLAGMSLLERASNSLSENRQTRLVA